MEFFVNDIVKLTHGDSVKLGKIAEIGSNLVRIADTWYDLNHYALEVLFSESSGIGDPRVDTGSISVVQ
jgi:hypothetical protein